MVRVMITAGMVLLLMLIDVVLTAREIETEHNDF